MNDQLVVHVGTQVAVLFGRLDAEGNVVDRRPCEFALLRLDEAAFTELKQAIFAARVQFEAEWAPPIAPPVAPEPDADAPV